MTRLVQLRSLCNHGNKCPTLHYLPDSDEFLIQGYAVTDSKVLAELSLPAGYTVVRVPSHLLSELPQDSGSGDMLVHGREVTDVELLAELDLPAAETAVRVSAHSLPALQKGAQPC